MSAPSIVVVANPHRPALVVQALAGVDYRVSCTRDYELPADFVTGISLAAYNQVGAYRCFRGHQDAVALASSESVLVLEDDAVPNTPEWLTIVESISAAVNDVDVISLHGRAFDPGRFDRRGVIAGRDVLVPRFWCGPVRIFGSLAYVIRRDAARRFGTMCYDGVPMDLLLPNRFKFCLVHPSPFDHDRRYPSLVG